MIACVIVVLFAAAIGLVRWREHILPSDTVEWRVRRVPCFDADKRPAGWQYSVERRFLYPWGNVAPFSRTWSEWRGVDGALRLDSEEKARAYIEHHLGPTVVWSITNKEKSA